MSDGYDGKIKIDIKLNTDKVKEQAEVAKSSVEKLAGSMNSVLKIAAVGFAVKGMKDAIGSFVEASDRVNELSQKLGMSRTAFQKWDYILKQNGASIDNMGVSFKTLRDNIEKSATTGGSALDRLGVSIRTQSGALKTQDQILMDTVAAFQRLEQGTVKSSLATDIFGRGAAELMPTLNSVSGDVEALAKQAEDLGLIMSNENVDAGAKLGDTLDSLAAVGKQLLLSFLGPMIPMVESVAQGFMSWASDGDRLKKILEAIGNAIKVGFESGAIPAMIGFAAAVKITTSAMSVLDKVMKGSMIGKIFLAFEAGVAIVSMLASAFSNVASEAEREARAQEEAYQALKKNEAAVNEILGPVTELTAQQALSQDQIDQLVEIYPQLTDVMKAGVTTQKEAAELTRKEALALAEKNLAIERQIGIDAKAEVNAAAAHRAQLLRDHQKRASDNETWRQNQQRQGLSTKLGPVESEFWSSDVMAAELDSADKALAAAQARAADSDKRLARIQAERDSLAKPLTYAKDSSADYTASAKKKEAKEAEDWNAKLVEQELARLQQEKETALERAKERKASAEELLKIAKDYDAQILVLNEIRLLNEQEAALKEGGDAAAIEEYYRNESLAFREQLLRDRLKLEKEYTEALDAEIKARVKLEQDWAEKAAPNYAKQRAEAAKGGLTPEEYAEALKEIDAKEEAAYGASVERQRQASLEEARAAGASAEAIANINAFYDAQITDFHEQQLKAREAMDKEYAEKRAEEEKARADAAAIGKGAYASASEQQSKKSAEAVEKRDQYEKEWADRAEKTTDQKLAAIREERDLELQKARDLGASDATLAAINASYGAKEQAALAQSPEFSAMASAGDIIKEVLMNVESLGKVFNWFKTIISSVAEDLGPTTTEDLEPIVGILFSVAGSLSSALKPALKALKPLIDLIADLFIFLYNKILVPVMNAALTLFVFVYNAFADFINGILWLVDQIPFVDVGRITKMDQSAVMVKEITKASGQEAAASAGSGAKSFAAELADENDELEKNRALFTQASKAADAYASVLTQTTKGASSFFESLQQVGSDMAKTLIDSITSGFSGDDFLFAMQDYIRNAVIKAAIFTDTLRAKVASIGTAIATAIASGATPSSIDAIRGQLADLYAQAESAATTAGNMIDSVFASYAVGSLSISGDQLAKIHANEMILPAGIAQEARSAGILISPLESLSSAALAGAGRVINLASNAVGVLQLDGREIGRASFQFQDQFMEAAYGA